MSAVRKVLPDMKIRRIADGHAVRNSMQKIAVFVTMALTASVGVAHHCEDLTEEVVEGF